jgi:predicted metal-dependent hydrolase
MKMAIINRKANKTMYQILDTLAHELIHIKHSNHNKTHKLETKKFEGKII